MAVIERLLWKDPENPLKSLTWVGCAAISVDSRYYYLMHDRIQLLYKVKVSQGFQNYTSLHSLILMPPTAISTENTGSRLTTAVLVTKPATTTHSF